MWLKQKPTHIQNTLLMLAVCLIMQVCTWVQLLLALTLSIIMQKYDTYKCITNPSTRRADPVFVGSFGIGKRAYNIRFVE